MVTPYDIGYRVDGVEQINGAEQIRALMARASGGEIISLVDRGGVTLALVVELGTGVVWLLNRGTGLDMQVSGDGGDGGVHYMLAHHCPMTVDDGQG